MKKTISLYDSWVFAPKFSQGMLDENFNWDESLVVNIPHSIETDFNYFDEKDQSFNCCYSRILFLSGANSGSRVVLKFDGILSYAEVYVNGIFVTSHKGESAFEADITVPFKYDFENRIVIKVDSNLRKDVPSNGDNKSIIRYGGLFRDVFLEINKGEEIRDAFVVCSANIGGEKSIKILVDLYDYYPDTTLKALILDGNGTIVATLPDKAVLRRDMAIAGFVDELACWTSGAPALYTAKIIIERAEKVLDIKLVKFGFRKAEFKRNGFFLNGENIKLIGLNRIESYPVVGRAMPSSLQIEDANILRNFLGCNVVRTHGIPSKDFIGRCDEIGLMVIIELTGETYIGKAQWRESYISMVSDCVKTFRNSPSVIAWGVRVNDSDDCDELYFKTNKIAHELDSTRQTLGSRNFMASRMYEDIFGFNDYPSKTIFSGRLLTKPTKTGKLFVPYIITEHTGKSYPTKSYDNETRRLNQAFRHLKIINQTLAVGKVSGAIGMSFADYSTSRNQGSGDNINHYGVLDSFRNPKLAAYAYASQFSKAPVLEFSSSLAPSEFSGKLYVFTNCDYIKLFRNTSEVGVFYPNKKQFNHLPHPPILIDDLLGELLTLEGMKPYQSKLFKRLLKQIEKSSNLSLKFIDKALAFILRKSLGLNHDNFLALADKYSLNEPTEFSAVGFIGADSVIEKKTGAGNGKKAIVKCNRTNIKCAKSYEIVKIDIKVENDLGNILNYDFSPIEATAEGSVEIVGNSRFSLIAGQGSFYVKTTQSGKGLVNVKTAYSEEKVELEVYYDTMERV